MPRITGQFTITHNGNQITFTLVGETYKSVDTESGVKSRKVIKWQATEHDAELGVRSLASSSSFRARTARTSSKNTSPRLRASSTEQNLQTQKRSPRPA